MEHGIGKYTDKDIQNNMLSYLNKYYDQQNLGVKCTTLLSMFRINKKSPQTHKVIKKAMKIPGDGKGARLIRQIASDIDKYLKIGDKKFLDKHTVTTKHPNL
ncbi:MAG: hypothetical protein K9N48_02010 [Verrucomicrobia bacterium]|nr:hypothetical protein [Verrucomicrobiota bacterium]MCF7709197.1 hypothetical protein [Verrucomicrobiota bacterium]